MRKYEETIIGFLTILSVVKDAPLQIFKKNSI